MNNDIFKANNLEYPTTMEELQEVSQKLREAGIEPLAVGEKDGWPALLLLGDLYLQQTGYDSVDKLNSGEVKFADDPYMKSAMETLADLGSSNVSVSYTHLSPIGAKRKSMRKAEVSLLILFLEACASGFFIGNLNW